MTGSMLVLGAIALIVLLVGFGFLLGLLRGFRKSLYFTIVFIVVVIISFVFATVLAKSVYSGSTLWKAAKSALPNSMTEGSEGVHSLKEFIRFYITHNYTEMLENGMTAGESIVANENAMGIVDGLIVMILKVAMLITCYIVLTVLFYIVFGLIYILFLRPKTYIETETTTDEEGNETVEEREIKPKKKRLSGGLIGAAKGFVKAMIILIPISFAIGMIAQIEVPTNSSSVNMTDSRFADSSKSSDSFERIINACKTYDNSIGRIYCGLDDFVMDRVISYDVKGANGKKVNVVVRKEVKGFINIYNVINEEIGIDNINSYDFKNNLNSPEMKKIVAAITDNISKSNATTTLLSAVGEEATVILQDKASKNDSDMKLIFEELDLKGKDNIWWKEQISQLNDIYLSFTEMNLDFSQLESKNYNLVFKDTTSESFDHFVDDIFENELIEMLINGSVKYAVKKLPEDYSEVQETTNQVVNDKEVDKELKAFSKFIDIIRDDIRFNNGSVDTNSLTIKTLNDIVDTEILVNSKIVGKLTCSVLKSTLGDLSYGDSTININKSIFDDANFVINDEVKALVKVLSDGFGMDYSIGDLNSFADTSNVGNVSDMLKSSGLANSKICNELFSKLLPMVLADVTPSEDYSSITWANEFKSLASTLEIIYGRTEIISNLANFNFDTMTYRKLSELKDSQDVWSGRVITKILNGVAIPFIEGMEIDGASITLDYDASRIIWKNELAGIINIGLWASDTDGIINDTDYNNTLSGLESAIGDDIKVIVLRTLGEEVQTEKNTELLHAFANASLKQLLGEHTGDSKDEFPALANVADTLATGEGNLKAIRLSDFDNLNRIYTSTIDALSDNTYKSIYLMYTMSDKLSDPMSTPNMPSWTSIKWKREMPRIGEVLKTLADDDEAIVIDEIKDSMENDSEIKKETFRRIELNIGYSEALENMFENALENSLKDEVNNPYTFPNPPAFNDEATDIYGTLGYNKWWDDEITGLVNIIYKKMGDDSTLKLSDFNDVDEVEVKVIKELYQDAYRVSEINGMMIFELKRKDYSNNYKQHTNIGVSEYLQYIFKPNFRDLSKNGDNYFDYDLEEAYDWDHELEHIMNVFLTTQMVYDNTTGTLRDLDDEESVSFEDEVNFRLLSSSQCTYGAKEAAERNKATLTSIKNNISYVDSYNSSIIHPNIYLQYVLAPEMKRLMNSEYIAKDPTNGSGNATGWSNDEWINEMTYLDELAQALINEDHPKMEGLSFYDLEQDKIDAICSITPKSYLLQSKMSKPLVDAGINCTAISSASTLTGEDNLMTYIINYEWSNGKNEAYEAVMDTLDSKIDGLKSMKNGEYVLSSTKCQFNDDNGNPIVILDPNTGMVTDGTGVNPYLNDNVDTKIDAVKTYSEYALMVEALRDSGDFVLNSAANKVADRGNAFEYQE